MQIFNGIFILNNQFYNVYTVITNIKWNDCRLLHNNISISKKERRLKLFRFNVVTVVSGANPGYTYWSASSL